jgi:hypothetical protein
MALVTLPKMPLHQLRKDSDTVGSSLNKNSNSLSIQQSSERGAQGYGSSSASTVPRPPAGPQTALVVSTARDGTRKVVTGAQDGGLQTSRSLEKSKKNSSEKRSTRGAGRESSARLVVIPAALAQCEETNTSEQAQHGTSSTAGSTLPPDYVTNIKARMKLISIDAYRGPRVDPISSWPMALPNESVVVNESLSKGQGRVVLNSTARPPLAIEIESHIRKEVQALTRTVPRPSILQLMPIYREAFSCFASHFREYGPTLSLIQKHYDTALDSLGILQQKVDKTNTELQSLRETFHLMLEKEKATMQNQVRDLKLQLEASKKLEQSRQIQLNDKVRDMMRLQDSNQERDNEYEELIERYRLLASTVREQGAKSAKLVARCDQLQIENDRLLHHVANLEGKLLGGLEFIDVNEDRRPARMPGRQMSISLPGGIRSPKDSSGYLSSLRGINPPLNAQRRFSTLSQDDVDLDNVDELRELLYEEEAKVKKLTRANVLLLQQQKELTKRVEKLQRSKDDDTLTPRPDWVSVSEVLHDFTPNQLQCSDEILDELISYFKEKLREDHRVAEQRAYSSTVRQWLGEEDLCEGDLVGKGKHFVAKGTGPHVPIYLRHRGLLRNQYMKKGYVENLLEKFWKERRNHLRLEGQLGAKKIDEYFHEWLEKESPTHRHAVNLAYNLLAVCEANQYDPDCSMTLRILRGEISEWAMYDQLDMVDKLHEIVANHDKSKQGAVTRLTVQKILNRFFVAKSMDDMLRLRFALIRFCGGTNIVDYEALFNEDEEGNQTKFVEMMRTQHMQEIAHFVVEVEEAIREVINQNEGTVSIGSARTAIKLLDTAMPMEKIDEMLAFGCKMTTDELFTHGELYTVQAELLLERIRTGVLLKRYSRREEDEESSSDDHSHSSEEEDLRSDLDELDAERDRRDQRAVNRDSSIARTQRQEEIQELLKDLNLDAIATMGSGEDGGASGGKPPSPLVPKGVKVGTGSDSRRGRRSEPKVKVLHEPGGPSPIDTGLGDDEPKRFSPSLSLSTFTVIGDSERIAKKESRRQQRERKLSNAEAALIAQEERLQERKKKEDEQVRTFQEFGSKYGVTNVSRASLKHAAETAKAVEEQQSIQFSSSVKKA